MQTPLSSRWTGHYLDGRTAARYPVTVTVTREGLTLKREEAGSQWWPFDQLRMTQGFTPGDPVRFERGGEFPEAVVITDPGFLAAVHQIAPHLQGRFRAPARRSTLVLVALSAAAGALALAAAMYVWGVPALADIAASRVPVAWEERLGEQVVDAFVPQRERCRDAEGQRALDGIAATLLASAPRSPYTIRITVADDPVVNAIAAPGGYLVIFRGLLEQTTTPEELAGVLAHEIQHVLHRDGTRALFRELSLGVLLSIATGGGGSTPLEVARAVGGLRYQRADEERADREGMKMVQAARIDPQGMVAMYALLEKKGKEPGEPPTYLSSHPRTADRLAQLRRLAGQATYGPITLLPEARWAEIRTMCE